jgi:AcrR family transcriptional regulator
VKTKLARGTSRVADGKRVVVASSRATPRVLRDANSGSAIEPLSAELLRVARRAFLRDGTLEMRSLARELKIGRATLYRWARDRENLLSEVLLSIGLANLRHAELDTGTPSGPRRICDVTDLYLKRMRANANFQKFLRSEPEVAERVMLDSRGKLYRGWQLVWADFVRRVEKSSRWTAPVPAATLARIMMRVSTAFMLSGLHVHDRPDTNTTSSVLRLILGIGIEREGPLDEVARR